MEHALQALATDDTFVEEDSMEPYDPLEVPAQQGPILASLLNFRPICEPIIKAWEPRSICEVGIEAGMASQWLVDLGSTLKCEYHAVDPTVEAAPFTSVEGSAAHFHSRTSHEYLAEAPLHDVYFIDGDHNYYTVSKELQLIADKAEAAGKRPLIFLHDVSWPWARRDLYYRPDDIPAEARQESAVGGSLHPDVVATGPPGGFEPAGSHPFALRASKVRNGVLTAVEDFLASASGWEFLMLPNGFGLGLLIPTAELTPLRDAALAPLRTALKCLDPFLKQIEYNRVSLICGFHDNHRLYLQALEDAITIQNRLNDASSRIHALNLQADHAVAAKEALALQLHQKLSVDHARFAEEKREWKEMREQWKTGKQHAQKQFRDAIHHVRALQSGIFPSSRRRKEARAFLAGVNEKTFLDLPTKPKTPAATPAAQAPTSLPAPPAAPNPTAASPQGQAFDALNYYESRAPHPQNVLDAFHGDWSSAMPSGSGVSAEPGRAKLFDDDRVLWAHQSLGGFEGQEVLELGPLEGAHTWTLQKLGAKAITAIEANRRAFLKCLCIKEVFKMDRASFLLGDFVAYLKESTARYDTVVACGVLYHMTDPMELLGLIARATDRVFLWTHYYDPAVILAKPDLARRFRDLEQAEYEGLAYESAQQSYQEAVQWSGFCGGSRPTSRWLSRQSILNALKHFGFGSIEIGFDQPDHPNGPAFAVCAKRVPA